MKLGHFAGIDVFLHWTFAFAPIALILQSWYVGNSIAMSGLLLLLLCCVFGCVLLHEFGHALTARRFNVQTKDIILTPIGGLARLVRMPKKPFHELVITIAGPAVNLLISATIAVFILLVGRPFEFSSQLHFADLPLILLYINLFLCGFNLIPAFPMDGGRILRASLASIMPFSTATLVAGSIGQIIAVAFAVYGLLIGEFSLVAVGIFVFIAGRSEIQLHQSIDQSAQKNDPPE